MSLNGWVHIDPECEFENTETVYRIPKRCIIPKREENSMLFSFTDLMKESRGVRINKLKDRIVTAMAGGKKFLEIKEPLLVREIEALRDIGFQITISPEYNKYNISWEDDEVFKPAADWTASELTELTGIRIAD